MSKPTPTLFSETENIYTVVDLDTGTFFKRKFYTNLEKARGALKLFQKRTKDHKRLMLMAWNHDPFAAGDGE